jgi:hypothetical protein
MHKNLKILCMKIKRAQKNGNFVHVIKKTVVKRYNQNQGFRYAVPQIRGSFNIATNGIGSLNLYRFNVNFFISIHQGTAYRFRL